MTDLTLEDLAGDAADAAADAAEEAATEEAESGESLMELIEFMDERGYLGPLMFGDDINTNDAQPTTDATPAAGGGGGDTVELNAANIAALAGQIEERVGDVPISRIRSFAENNPDRVNGLVDQIGDAEEPDA